MGVLFFSVNFLAICFAFGPSSVASAESAPAPTPPAAPIVVDAHAGKTIHRDNPQAIPTGKPAAVPTSSYQFDSGQVIVALAGVIGLIFALRQIGRHYFPAAIASGRSGAVKVLARCPLAPRQQVLLIQIGRRIVVASDCASQISSLCQITDPDEVAALIGQIQQEKIGSGVSPFTSWFKRAGDVYEDEKVSPAEMNRTNMDMANADMAGIETNEMPDAASIRQLTEKVRDVARQLSQTSRPA